MGQQLWKQCNILDVSRNRRSTAYVAICLQHPAKLDALFLATPYYEIRGWSHHQARGLATNLGGVPPPFVTSQRAWFSCGLAHILGILGQEIDVKNDRLIARTWTQIIAKENVLNDRYVRNAVSNNEAFIFLHLNH